MKEGLKVEVGYGQVGRASEDSDATRSCVREEQVE